MIGRSATAHVLVVAYAVYVAIDDQETFDAIDLPARDNGEQVGADSPDRVLVKAMPYATDGVMVVFQRWLHGSPCARAPIQNDETPIKGIGE